MPICHPFPSFIFFFLTLILSRPVPKALPLTERLADSVRSDALGRICLLLRVRICVRGRAGPSRALCSLVFFSSSSSSSSFVFVCACFHHVYTIFTPLHGALDGWSIRTHVHRAHRNQVIRCRAVLRCGVRPHFLGRWCHHWRGILVE